MSLPLSNDVGVQPRCHVRTPCNINSAKFNRYYENHRTVEQTKIFCIAATPTFFDKFHKFLRHVRRATQIEKGGNCTTKSIDLWNGPELASYCPAHFLYLNTFSKFISVFYNNRKKSSYEETFGEVSPFFDNVLYNLYSQVFFESFSTIIEPSIYRQFFRIS